MIYHQSHSLHRCNGRDNHVVTIPFPLRAIALFGLSLTLFGLTGCESVSRYVPSFISPYKVEIQQGNVITPEQVAQLKVGMTRNQVRFLLGTPLLTDIFHTNRWDYLFRLKKSDGSIENSKLTVFFDDNRLQNFVTTLATPATETPTTAAATATKPAAPLSDTAVPPAAPPAPAQTPVANSIEAPAVTLVTSDNPPTTPPALNDTAALESRLESWRAAWENRNIDAYLSHYASNFQPQGMDRAHWEAQRRERLSKPKQIKLKLQDIRFEQTSPERATAQFTQVYSSDLLRERGKKTLSLIQEEGQWRIETEQFQKTNSRK